MSYEFPRGRIGHARVAVITVIKEEFQAAQAVLRLEKVLAGTLYYVDEDSESKNWHIVLTQCSDRGNVPSALTTADVIEDFRPQVIILLGVAGGICDGVDGTRPRDGIGFGDVVIADYVSYTEYLKIEGDRIRLRKYAFDHPSHSLNRNVAMALINSLKLCDETTHLVPPEPRKFKLHAGEIVAGEKVLGGFNDLMQARLLEPFEKALAVDMESYGVARRVFEARSSVWYNPRYAVIRGISDLVGLPENNADRTAWKLFASNSAAIVAKKFIEKLSIADGHTMPNKL